MSMDKKRLAEIATRAAAASAGPWETVRNNFGNLVAMRITDARIVSGPEGDLVYVPSFPWNGDNGNAEAAFIAHARKDVPDLLEHVEELRDALLQIDGLHPDLSPWIRRLLGL